MGKVRSTAISVLFAALLPNVAAAEICAQDAICASNPPSLVTALQAAGYKADLGVSSVTGNPRISSAASGYEYDIFFYGCNNHVNCDSIAFSITFENDGTNSAELANAWNLANRFSAMAYDPKDGTLQLTYDVTTRGGLNKLNFKDDIEWWATILGIASKFFKDHAPAAAGKS